MPGLDLHPGPRARKCGAQMIKKQRVLIADDNELARVGARKMIDEATEFVIVGEARDGTVAVRLIAKYKPQLLLIDMYLPELNAVSVLRRISSSERPKALVMCHRGEAASMVECIGAGAEGFLNLETNAHDLVSAMRAIADGGQWLHPPLCEEAFVCAAAMAAAISADPYHTLTEREREVFLLAAEGQNNALIGHGLHISPRTVEIHKSRALRKLGLVSQTDLVRYTLRRGLASLDA